MIINRQNLRDLFVGFNAAFTQGFRDAPQDWPKIATPVPSTTREEHYAWLGQFPRLREWVGERVVNAMASHDYRVVNQKFEATVEVARDDIEDDHYGVYKPLFQEMGYAAATHPNDIVFPLLAAGFTGICYDGQPFFDADHPVGLPGGSGGVVSVSNVQPGSGAPWFLLDVSRALKPIIFQKRREYDMRGVFDLNDEKVFMTDKFLYGVDARVAAGYGFWQQAFGSKDVLSAANYAAARQAMMAFKSDEGRPLGIKPTLLVCGPSNEGAALEILKAERNASGATNIYRGTAELLVTPWLD
ncbi:MAG: Mu-like prophage major head subunit gpT family protein [Sinobacteraceae bacterium]|nr:Mu-like prophage major head subunit gpT family protein [Nevskiaceae bacterium]